MSSEFSSPPEISAYSQAQEQLLRFITNPALHNLAVSQGFEQGDSSMLDGLVTFAAQHWDFRKGQERQVIEWADTSDPEVAAAVFDFAGQLGMVESSSPSGNLYDYLVILGGANKSPLQRLQYAIEQGKSFGTIVLLGSNRPVKGAETENVKDYAPGAKNEWDLMNKAVEKVFGVTALDEKVFDLWQPNATGKERDYWRARYYETSDDTPIISLLAPAKEGQDRANTSDTYAFMRLLAGEDLNPDSKVLLSTNAFYVPFQHLDAVRELTLPTGAQVETIGFDAAYGGVTRKPDQLLQETKSAIDAAVRLKQRLTDNHN